MISDQKDREREYYIMCVLANFLFDYFFFSVAFTDTQIDKLKLKL